MTLTGLFACDNIGTAPVQLPEEGVKGRILDALGVPVSGAQIYLLFGFENTFADPPIATSANRVTKADTLPFSFQSVFPNPVGNSFYARFTMPLACSVTVSLHRSGESTAILERTEVLPSGWYQQFYSNVVETYGLPNGLYEVRLAAEPVPDGEVFNATENILIVSDLGPPNLTTERDGSYYIKYSWIAEGDSIITSYDGTQFATVHFGRTVNLLLTQGDQRIVIRNIDFLPGTLLRRDIILKDTLR